MHLENKESVFESSINQALIKHQLTERFLSYVAVESQSDDSSTKSPSTEGQLKLAELLAQEMSGMGLSDIKINEFGVLQAFLPSNQGEKKIPKIGFVCHLDTVDVGLSKSIHPKIIKNYAGGDICQRKESNAYILTSEHPEILSYIGDDIIVSDGSSVLGADNKAAIANVMTALDFLNKNKAFPHGDIFIAFVPDEEIGLRGARNIDFEHFKPDFAYTIDCCELGEIVFETFNAGKALLKIRGITAHPMSAKNVLVNPIMVAHDFIALLDRNETPENTEGREGYIWVTDIKANALDCSISLNIRDHDKGKYEAKKAFLEKALNLTRQKHPRAKLTLEMSDVYGNISDAISDKNKGCIDLIYRAFEELKIKPKALAMRGGTDGSFISTLGIPTPNYFTGAHNFHSSAEFLPLKAFLKSCLTTLKIIELSTEE